MQNINARLFMISFIRHYSRSVRNPGLQKRMNVLSERDQNNLEDIDIEKLDTDFMNPLELEKEFKKEIHAVKQKNQYHLVYNKYFKQKELNFLTISDKVQIKFLHNSDPNEWTVEKLADAFPALPHVISKILKSNWTMKSDKKINHDRNVENNWKLFKEGKLTNVSKDTLEHIKKFSNRKKQIFTENKVITKIINKPKCTEFSSIITNYEESVNRTNQKDNQPNIQLHYQSNKDISNGNSQTETTRMKSPTVTLTALKENILKNINAGKTVDEYDRMMLSVTPEENKNVNLEKSKISLRNNTEIIRQESKPIEFVKYPEKIAIPKLKYKKNYLYKVNDCYYTSNGHFLYRVPGMY